MKFFKRKPKNKPKKEQNVGKSHMFGKLPLEEFKARLLMYYKQECALDDENSYFEPQDSLFGEMFDNAIRIRFLKEENTELEGQYDDDELKAQAKAEYEEDKKKAIST
jgi:hypothetical protein